MAGLGFEGFRLLEKVRGGKKPGGQQKNGQRLGVIPSDYTSGPPTVLFDGEETATARTYPAADHVTTLAPGKTVLVQFVGGSGVIVACWTR